MGLYRKRPVVVEAIQIDASDYDSMCEIVEWCGGRAVDDIRDEGEAVIAIDTLEGTMFANDGAWVIKGLMGEFYACDSEVFALTYEEVDDVAEVLDHFSALDELELGGEA